MWKVMREAAVFATAVGYSSLNSSRVFVSGSAATQVPNVPPQHLYYATAAPFLAFYALFAFILYPLAPVLHSYTAQWLSWLGVLPQGLAGLVAVVQQWLFSLFYVAGDLWGPVMITLAFW
jgi:AAA family ATP:ADP antiporter